LKTWLDSLNYIATSKQHNHHYIDVGCRKRIATSVCLPVALPSRCQHSYMMGWPNLAAVTKACTLLTGWRSGLCQCAINADAKWLLVWWPWDWRLLAWCIRG